MKWEIYDTLRLALLLQQDKKLDLHNFLLKTELKTSQLKCVIEVIVVVVEIIMPICCAAEA